MSKETIVIVAEGCAGCKEVLRDLENRKAKFKVMDVTKSLEAARIVRDLGIVKVPAIVTVERTEEYGTEICALDLNNKVKCVVKPSGEDES